MQSILTLQPDHRGKINVSEQTMCASEYMHLALDTGNCTKNKLMTADYGGRGRAGLTVEPIEPDGTDDAMFEHRTGAVVLPFMRHLLGTGNHAFCGDTRIVVAVAADAAADALVPHDICTLSDWKQDHGIHVVSKFNSAKSVHGVIVGLVEDKERRTYRGISSEATTIGERSMFIVQLVGVAKVHSDGLASAAFDTAAYGSTNDTQVKSGGAVFLGYYCGKALANNPDDRENETSYIYLPAGARTEPFHFQGFASGAHTLSIRCGVYYRNGAAMEAPKVGGGTSKELSDVYEYDCSGFGAEWRYIYAVMKPSASPSYCPEIYPASFEYEDYASYFESANQPALRYHPILAVKMKTVGGETIFDQIDQLWRGGNITNSEKLPDADFTNEKSETARKTIQYNPEATDHHRELQLYGIHGAINGAYNICYFADTSSADPAIGELKWAAIDSHLATPEFYSLQVYSSSFQIYGFATGTPAVTAPVNAADMTDYSFLVRAGKDGGGTCVSYVSLASLNLGGTLDCNDVYDCINDWEAKCDWISSCCDQVKTCMEDVIYVHNALGWAVTTDHRADAQGNTDHDYRYFKQGAEYNTNGGACSCQSIGYATTVPGHTDGSLRIDLLACTLQSGTTVYVDWDGMLLKNGGTDKLDWNNNWLTGGSWTHKGTSYVFTIEGTEDITAETATSGALRVVGGASIGDRLQVLDATDAGGDKTGALYVKGGVDVAAKVWALGGFYIDDTNGKWDAADVQIHVTNVMGLSAVGFAGLGSSNCGIQFLDDHITLNTDFGLIDINYGTLQLNGQLVGLIDCNLDINGTPTPAKVLGVLI